ncbi:hypothetical protein BDV12DRAFT_201442 [Aspergillus spectabilis]
MTFTIHPLLPTDALETFAVSDAAFASFNRMLHTTYPPSAESQAKLAEIRLEMIKLMPEATMFKAVDESGKIIGAARWIVALEDEIVSESIDDVVDGYLMFVIPETDVLATRGFYTMTAKEKRVVLGLDNGQAAARGELIMRRRVELETLFVHPEHQGQGVGRALLQWGINEAERLGLMVYLEATEAGRPLYEQFGFKNVKSVDFDAAEFGGEGRQRYTFMIRQPRGEEK